MRIFPNIQSFFGAFALLALNFSVGLGLSSCKPRTSESGLREAQGPASNYQVDAVAAAEAAKIRAACEGAPGSFFRGTGAGDRVDYVATAEVKGDGPQTKIPAFYEEARFVRGKWQLSEAVHGRADSPECLKAVTVLGTQEFAAALGCTKGFTCTPSPDVCASGTCLASVADAKFDAPATVDAGGSGIEASSFALAGDDDDKATDKFEGVTCKPSGRGFQLTGPKGSALGKPVDTEVECNALVPTTQAGVVCAWSGAALTPTRTVDGAPVGKNPAAGAKTLAACAAMTATAKNGVVCSWSGSGYAPFSINGTIKPIGNDAQSPAIEHCAEKTVAIEDGRICSWDGKAVRIFTIESGQLDQELGLFESYKICGNVVKLVANADARKGYLADLAAAKRSDVKPDDGHRPEGSGLNLAEGGWTWGDCNDPARNYHMVAVNGSSMVCQGKIDALYSWGPAKKISWLQGQSYSGRLTRDGTNAPIFTTQTSYATYGYGDYAIRFHIGSNARFQFFDNVNAYDVCEQVPSSQVDNTIAVRYWAIGAITGVDYILCGLGPIESWSYGTRTHYQEFTRETSWISANNYRNYELYVKQDGVDQIPPILDSHSFAPSVWTGNLSRHAATFPGRIFFNPSAPSQDEASHFATKWDTYINSSGGGGGGGAVIGNGGGGAVLPQGGGNDADDLRPQDLVGGKFKDTQGRSLWLNAGRVCSVKRATGTPQSCAWEFRSGGTIVVTMAPSTIWYYSAKNKDSVCFTGEGTPGATCTGIMTRYN